MVFDEQNINNEQKEKQNKKYILIAILSATFIILITSVIIYNNRITRTFKDVTTEIVTHLGKSEDFDMKILKVIKRDNPETYITFLYDKNLQQFVTIVTNKSKDIIKFYPAEVRLIFDNGKVLSAYGIPEDTIKPGYSKNYYRDLLPSSLYSTVAISYYPPEGEIFLPLK